MINSKLLAVTLSLHIGNSDKLKDPQDGLSITLYWLFHTVCSAQYSLLSFGH